LLFIGEVRVFEAVGSIVKLEVLAEKTKLDTELIVDCLKDIVPSK